MNILLLGGTGAIGSYLVDLLNNDSEYQVYITSRKLRDSYNNINYINGSIKEDVFLISVLKLKKWDCIVDFMVYSTEEFKRRIDVILQETNQYIFLSSARVYSNEDILIRENTPRLLDISNDKYFLNTDEYSLSKARQENYLINSKKNNWTIVRPYISYSEERLQLGIQEKEDWLYRALHGKAIFFPKEMLPKETTLTYGLDVARGISSLIGNTHALGNIIHITSSCSISWEKILACYIKVLTKYLGHAPRVIFLDLKDFDNFYDAKYQIIYDRMFDRKFDNTKLNGFINTSDFTNAKIGLEQCLLEFLKKPNFRQINWKSEALKDKYSKEYTPLKTIKGLKQKVKYLFYRFFYAS